MNENVLIIAHRRVFAADLSPSYAALGSAVFANRFEYLRLVLGVEMELVDVKALTVPTEANGAVSVTLDRIPPQLLLALSAYRLGDHAAMEKHLTALPRAEGLPPGPRAVAAGLLALVGRQGPAFQIAEKISGALLLDEELTFLKRAL